MSFEEMWDALVPVGRDAGSGGYRRYVWTPAELECREWFESEAVKRGLDVTCDRNGNLWAWLGDPDADGPGIVTGSHLDSVPDGGAYDGPLGVISAFEALDLLREKGVVLRRPLGIVAFADEEGARFGVACAGSRLMTGLLDPDRARSLKDSDGVTYAEAMTKAGHEPDDLGKDTETLKRIGTFVELHIEQGRGLIDQDSPIAMAGGIWAHGRWRFDFTGEPNHAGTTRMDDRQDPMLSYAMTVLAANKQARVAPAARATFGRVDVKPNSTNGIPSQVTGWLDLRAPEQENVDAVVACISRLANERAGRDGTNLTVTAESISPRATFDDGLRERLATALDNPPVLDTQAGHDAGVLAEAGIPAAMLYVRNPTGVSHSPAEFAERDDCLKGVEALAKVLEDLLG